MRNKVCGAIGILTLLALGPAPALGDTVYVTDNLRLGLYEAEDTSGRPIRMMDSGQAMEILTRDRNYANVRLPDGAEGWVKAAYLVDAKPAKLIVAEITAERDSLRTELETTKRAFAEPAAAIRALKEDAAAVDAQLAAANARILELEDHVDSVRGIKEQYRGSLPLSWVVIATTVCLVGGILLGMWWVDRRSRIRHGGIRIY